MMAEIEDFTEGFREPTYRGTRVNGQRVATWSSEHGWSGDSRVAPIILAIPIAFFDCRKFSAGHRFVLDGRVI
jgi:hypothetical protein